MSARCGRASDLHSMALWTHEWAAEDQSPSTCQCLARARARSSMSRMRALRSIGSMWAGWPVTGRATCGRAGRLAGEVAVADGAGGQEKARVLGGRQAPSSRPGRRRGPPDAEGRRVDRCPVVVGLPEVRTAPRAIRPRRRVSRNPAVEPSGTGRVPVKWSSRCAGRRARRCRGRARRGSSWSSASSTLTRSPVTRARARVRPHQARRDVRCQADAIVVAAALRRRMPAWPSSWTSHSQSQPSGISCAQRLVGVARCGMLGA